MFTLLQEIDLDKTGSLPPLINDYLAQKKELSHLFKYPFQLSAFADVIRDKANDNVDRKLLTEVLSDQYRAIPTSTLVTDNIQSLLSDKTFTIVAAHQPSLLLGPLFNIYKISCAINVSRQLKASYPEYNFVPVFWMGSEDHDIDELNNTFINGKKLEWKDAGTGAIGRLKTASLQGVHDELKAIFPDANFHAILEAGLKRYDSFGRLTQYIVNEIFKDQGLVVLDQDDVRLKRKFAEIIKEEVLHSTAQDVLKLNIEFLEQHYKAQAKPREINFFYLGEGFRERIIYNALTQKFEINNHKDITFTAEEMGEEIDAHPDRFSPNVIYRPLYQEVILPNLAFIGGAGELSYWLELKPLFDHYQVNYPMQVMRTSAAIVNPAVQKKLDKVGLKIADFFGDVEQLINRYVKENMPAGVDLTAEKQKVAEIFDAAAEKAGATDPTLKQNAITEKQKAIASIENIEAKMLKAEKRKQETAVTQIRNIHAILFPNGVMQERVENFLPFYSEGFIDSVVEIANPFGKKFLVMMEG